MNRMSRAVRKSFTLVEIIVAMSIFALLMLMVMQVFGPMQNVWETTAAKTKTYQNARVIMDLITADLQSAFYDANANPDSSWCYYQSDDEFSNGDVLWFLANRQKSVQAKNSSLVQTGYWTQNITRDGVDMLCLKNAVISNIASSIYNFNQQSAPHTNLTTPNVSVLDSYSAVLDNNIVSLRIIPVVQRRNVDGSFDNTYSYDYGTDNDYLPAYISIELELIDDNPAVRAEYAAGNSEKKEELKRKFSRIIEIDRGQFYLVNPATP